MAKFEEVYADLKGRTGLEPEMEKELCSRIAIIESQRDVVPPLTKTDWIMAVGLIAAVGLLPVVVEALRFGIQ
jgi:hypothetical protein